MSIILGLGCLFLLWRLAVAKDRLLAQDRKLTAIQDVLLLTAKRGPVTTLMQTIHGILNGRYE